VKNLFFRFGICAVRASSTKFGDLHIFDELVGDVDLEALDNVVAGIADNESDLAGAFGVGQPEFAVEFTVGKEALVELVAIFIQHGDAETAAAGIVVYHVEHTVAFFGGNVFNFCRSGAADTDGFSAIGKGSNADAGEQDSEQRKRDRFAEAGDDGVHKMVLKVMVNRFS